MSTMDIAQSRRASEIKLIRRSIDSIERDIASGVRSPNGMVSEYLVERQQFLREEAARLQEKITELMALGNDALVDLYVPEAKPVESIPLNEALGAQRAPTVRIANMDEPRPTQRVGPELGMAIPGGGPDGFKPGKVYTYG